MLTLDEKRYSQSLERGLGILGCFTPDESLLGIADIASKVGMSRSTTHRYVITLVQLGYLEQPASGGRKYRLGSRVTDLGKSALNTHPLRALGHTYLDELRHQISYTVSAAVLRNDEVVIVDWLRGFRGYAGLKLNIGPGSRLPLYCTSTGKVLLARLPKEKCREVIKGLSLIRQAPNTIVTKYALLNELEKIREADFAVNNEELVVGVHSIAMTVRSEDSVIGAVAITAPTSVVDYRQLTEVFGPHLLRSTDRISAYLASERRDGVASA